MIVNCCWGDGTCTCMLACFKLLSASIFLRTPMNALKSQRQRRRVTISSRKSIVPASMIVLACSGTLYLNTSKMTERCVVFPQTRFEESLNSTGSMCIYCSLIASALGLCMQAENVYCDMLIIPCHMSNECLEPVCWVVSEHQLLPYMVKLCSVLAGVVLERQNFSLT